tara:strand:- start:2402 stop:3172 length:771 start_codon:yes stop_codon:yes gene_type:complete
MSEDIKQTWIDYSLGKDLISTGDKSYYSKFSLPDTTIKCDKTGCGVYADRSYGSGDIIEESPVLVVRTTVEDLVDKTKLNDPVLLSKCLVYPTAHEVFHELGHPLILPTGNFFAYKQSLESNADVEYNRKYNIVTIRAKREISESEEIVLGSRENKYGFTNIDINKNLESNTTPETKGEKDMGCNCGKNKRNVTKLLDGTETPDEPEPLYKARKRKRKEREEKEREKKNEHTKFKSMVDGSPLKTIIAKKRSDDKV